jgi:hypothetical protein
LRVHGNRRRIAFDIEESLIFLLGFRLSMLPILQATMLFVLDLEQRFDCPESSHNSHLIVQGALS